MRTLKPLLVTLLTCSLLSCGTTPPAPIKSGFGKASQCGDTLVGVATEKRELEVVGATLKEFSLGKFDTRMTPEFQRITSEAAMNEEMKMKLACKAIEMAGAEGNPELVSYFMQLLSFLSSGPTVRERFEWGERVPVPHFKDHTKINNPEMTMNEAKTFSQVITFDSRHPNNKIFYFGDCPNRYCYVVERGKLETFGKTQGQIFHIFGTGLVADSGVTKEGKNYKTELMGVKNGVWGVRFLHVDGSSEYRWINPSSRETDRRPGKMPVKTIQRAVWLPLEEKTRVEMVSPELDISFTVLDDSVNKVQVQVEISPGTYCSNNLMVEGSVASEKVCREKERADSLPPSR